MQSIDLRKRVITPVSKEHSKNSIYIKLQKAKSRLAVIRRVQAASLFFVFSLLIILPQIRANIISDIENLYTTQAVVQNLRKSAMAHNLQLPLQQNDPKLIALTEYLEEKQSPLAKYAGELARMPNWKTLVGIAAAESSLCKKTSKNNCWGIGNNNTPLAYEDISQSLHYANYLLTKYHMLGMNPSKPETIVRTYVGYNHPSWVNNVYSVFNELAEYGLQ